MAANSSGLSDKVSPESIVNHPSSPVSTSNVPQTETKSTTSNSPCSCSNISIMQLFHEMKQEFPTVPDHVVSQLVAENCHNRPRCVEKLNEIEEEYALSAQAYPAQSIRYNKPPTPPRRCKNLQRQQIIESKSVEIKSNKQSLIKSDESSCEVTLVNSKKEINIREMCKFESRVTNQVNTSGRPVVTRPAPQRPNTLPLSTSNNLITQNKTDSLGYVSRPTRTAPPPPITAGMTVVSSDTSNPEPINVSLNVTVSPVPGRPPIRPRHVSEMTLQPEMPYSPPSDGNTPRSYTSVNFTLRPPSSASIQSPIDISAGPSLTYSSSSYDARQGYQSSLQITVGGASVPAFSAMRTRPSRYNNNNIVDEYCDSGNVYNGQEVRHNSSMMMPSTMYRMPTYGLLDASSCLVPSLFREGKSIRNYS